MTPEDVPHIKHCTVWFLVIVCSFELGKAQTGFRPLFHHTRGELIVDMLKSVTDWHTYNSD